MAVGQSFPPRDHASIRAELDRILASARFVNAARISDLLRYVVEEALAGRRDRLKAYTIAQDVFGRDGNFDQQRDPIVRVEASRLRKCLAEYYETAGLSPAFRIAIPKGGYAPTFTKQDKLSQKSRRWIRRSLVVLASLAILSGIWVLWHTTGPERSPEVRSPLAFLAVLPLTYHEDDIRAARLSDNFVDSTITLLARMPDLSVMAHESMMEFNRERLSLRSLRQDYGVTHALRGSIETLEDKLRLLVQLIDTDTSETIWSGRFEGNLRDVWVLQDELADQLLNAFSIDLQVVDREQMFRRYTENTEALALYRQGLFLILPPNETKRIQAARQVFARVREIDPDFAGGYAGAAWSYTLPVLFHNTSTPDENLAKALGLARQAIQADPSFGAGYAVLGFTQALAGDKVEALENARLAAAIQPGDAFVQFLKGVTFILSGIPKESFAALDEAMRLNPIEKRAPYLNVYGIARFANREYQSALALFAKNDARNGPRGPHMDIFRAAAHAHLNENDQASSIIHELNLEFPGFPYVPWLKSWLGRGKNLRSTLDKLSASGLTVREEVFSK